MMQPVLIPCRGFDVEVVLGPHDGLTIVEQIILRALAGGTDTIEALSSDLDLPLRLVLEVAVDLLARGLIDVSSESTVHVDERVLEAMGDPARPTKDWFVAFQSAHLPEPSTVRLVQELVSGEVFSIPRVPPTDRTGLPRMPEGDSVQPPDELPAGALLAAVTQAIRARRALAGKETDLYGDPLPRDARILSVRVPRASGAVGAGGHVRTRPFLLQGMISTTERGEEDPPRVAVLEPVDLPAQVRRRICTALDDLWNRGFARGAGQFFDRVTQQVLEGAEVDLPISTFPSLDLRRIAEILADATSDMDSAHVELVGLEGSARPALEDLVPYAAGPSVVVGRAADFRAATLDALRSAKQQVVLACPWVGQLGHSADLQTAFCDAVSRGISVVVVSGIDRERTPDDAAWRFLRKLAEEARSLQGALVFAERGAHSHAKLIACDADWAIVSSCNFLSARADDPKEEVGIRVQAGSDAAVPPTLQALLSWARRAIPDYLVQERCLDEPMVFGRAAGATPILLDVSAVGAANRLFGAAGVAVWRRAWQERAEYLGALASVGANAAVPVSDAEHREFLVQAVASATKRLLLKSHRVTVRGLSEPLMDGLRSARTRGVDVKIRHGAVDLEPEARERLDSLSRADISVESIDSHAKVLVCDDWAIVSSFNFLSVDPRTRSAHELGLRVFLPDIVDQLWGP